MVGCGGSETDAAVVFAIAISNRSQRVRPPCITRYLPSRRRKALGKCQSVTQTLSTASMHDARIHQCGSATPASSAGFVDLCNKASPHPQPCLRKQAEMQTARQDGHPIIQHAFPSPATSRVSLCISQFPLARLGDAIQHSPHTSLHEANSHYSSMRMQRHCPAQPYPDK